ncbi:MAG TPA: DUF4382 domain-containing protein [Puia sp.]|nr:DUF4382 domain-containing protein [Puia sp.]
MKRHRFKFRSFLLLLSAVIGLLIQSCNKSTSRSSAGSAHFEVLLTDDPSTYDAVNIDIQQVEILASADSSAADSGAGSGWRTVPLFRPGVYNLLDFRNGMDTVLGAVDIPAGTIAQIRLILGDSNTVVVGGESYPMKTPSAQQSGLKLHLDATLAGGIVYKLWIDFDAARSIVQTGNGKFLLKPVIRAYSAAIGGSIKGYVLPGAAKPEVLAIQGVDTLMALPDSATGYYFFGGVNAGAWNLLFQPADTTFADSSSTVTVSTGVVTDAGSMTLRSK